MDSNNTPRLETERLVLRKFTEHDMAALFSILRDKDVNTYLPWFPTVSMEEAILFYRKQYAEAYEGPSGYKYAVCLKQDNVPIGYINVSLGDSHDLGYGLQKEFWHRGITAEAGRAVVQQVKKDGLPYITATHDVRNPRSGNVMKQLGMSYRYSYEEQWKPKNILVIFRMYQLNLSGQSNETYMKYWDSSSTHFIETGIQSDASL